MLKVQFRLLKPRHDRVGNNDHHYDYDHDWLQNDGLDHDEDDQEELDDDQQRQHHNYDEEV